MRLHLPVSLFRTLLTCMVSLTLALQSSAATYPNGSKTYTTRHTAVLTLKGYESILFKYIHNSTYNKEAHGGAIYSNYNATYNGTFTLNDNGNVTFNGNSVTSSDYYAYGGAIDNSATFTMRGNGDVSFCGNSASTTSTFAYGGAIYNKSNATFLLSENGNVVFSGNSVTASNRYNTYGGAIYNSGATFTLSGNGDVSFCRNSASSRGHGGAIFNSGTFTLSGNGDVSFCENSASLYGGAIDNNYNFTLSGNGDVTFSGNTASNEGGAIDNGSTFTLSDNGDVTFSGNSASSRGGAIYNSGYFELIGNGDVSFSGNTASNEGGAIDNSGYFELIGNGDVSFCENSVNSSSNYYYAYGYGGAIYNGSFTMRGNGDVSFCGNSLSVTATSTSSDFSAYGNGGAIYNNCYFELIGNGNVTFSGNSVTVSSKRSSSYAYGGAISNIGATFTLSRNGAVTFSGNSVTASSKRSSSYAYGGAIYNDHYSTFTLSGNGNVIFEKNSEITGSTYRLRSICSAGTLNLAAPAGKNITFRDSVYASGTVNLNQDYTDAAGVVRKSTGSIIFTGATTASDLKTVKNGIAGTKEEILNSRTSEIATMANLFGGSLVVEKGAILTGYGISAAKGANATIRLNGGTLKEDDHAVTIGSGSTLTVQGASTLTAGTINLQAGSTLSFALSETNRTAAALTLSGTLLTGATTKLTVSAAAALDIMASYKILTTANGNSTAGLNTKTITLSGNTNVGYIHWDKGTLWLSFTTGTWRNASGNGKWDTTSTNWRLNGSASAYSNKMNVIFGNTGAGTVSLVATLSPKSVTVNNGSGYNYTFKGSGRMSGGMRLTKNGAGTLVMNNGNTYTGGTVITAGSVKAGGATSFGTGTITLKGGTLSLGSYGVANTIKVAGGSNLKGTAYKGALTIAANMGTGTNISIAKTATLAKGKVNGVLTGAAGVKVTGEATLAGKNTYKGTTSVAEGALLHLTGTVAGNYNVAGTLDASQKAIALGSGKAMTVADGGVVTGKVTVNSGATLTVKGTKSKLGTTVINGGTAVLNSTAATVQATGTGTSSVTVKGKKLTLGTNKSTLKMAATEAVNLNSGKLTINAVSSTYTGNLVAKGGTLDLASRTVTNNVYLYKATLAHAGALRGTLCVRDAAARYSGSLTLTSNNKLNFSAGSKLTVTGTLTLKGGTALTLAGSGWKAGSYTLMSAGTLSGKAATAFKVAKLSGFTSALTNSGKNVVLTLRKAAAKAAAAPDLTAEAEPALAAAPALAAEPMAEPTVTVPAVSADAKAAQSMADALVQADWAVVDAARAFTSGIRNRSTGTLTPDGKGAVWMNAIGSLARHSSVNGHSGSQVNLYGGAVGAEHSITEHHSIGAAVGGTHANIGNTPMGKLRQDTTHIALYGNSRMGSKFSADWAAAFGSTNAHGNLGDARAKWQQNSTELSARLTYAEMLNDNTQLRTFAGLDYDATNADRTNGGKTGSVQALRGEFGMGLTRATETYSLYGEVGMVGDMVRHNPVAEANGFRLKGANPGRIGLKATLGGSIRLNDTWSASASYNLETADDATMQSVNVGASRKF